jgi:hypothetical protein
MCGPPGIQALIERRQLAPSPTPRLDTDARRNGHLANPGTQRPHSPRRQSYIMSAPGASSASSFTD